MGKRNGKWEVFESRDGRAITTARTAREARRVAEALDVIKGGIHDYARPSDGWFTRDARRFVQVPHAGTVNS